MFERARSAGARIVGDTLVTGLDRADKRVFTDSGAVYANNILVATNGYTGDFISELK